MTPHADSTEPADIFSNQFSRESIKTAFSEHISASTSAGVDGLTPDQFKNRAAKHLDIIHRKCNSGDYSFAPYRQVLIPRGPKRRPRQLAIPTVRDRIVLYLLKEVLQEVFPDRRRTDLPNTYIADTADAIGTYTGDDLCWIRSDIRNFFPSINRDILFSLIQRRLNHSTVLSLLSRALLTPIVPKQYERKERQQYSMRSGVPQGLAISNLLAEIYGTELDEALKDECYFYRRYVDDILILVPKSRIGHITRQLSAELARLDLDESKNKRSVGNLDEAFQYLGYLVTPQDISVRQRTVERHIENVARVVTRYRRGGYDHIEDVATRREVFFEDINEILTGAISENKRYGWIFFFLEITDMELLHKIDAIAADIVQRLDFVESRGAAESKLKSTVRAYYEARKAPGAGYIRNYNNFNLQDKRNFLRRRDLIDNDASPDKIRNSFEKVRERRLRQLRVDATQFS